MIPHHREHHLHMAWMRREGVMVLARPTKGKVVVVVVVVVGGKIAFGLAALAVREARQAMYPMAGRQAHMAACTHTCHMAMRTWHMSRQAGSTSNITRSSKANGSRHLQSAMMMGERLH